MTDSHHSARGAGSSSTGASAAGETPSRDQLAEDYLSQLPFPPYPVQEEALLAWFTSDEGVLVCAPTGTGKTVIAEAALYEALHTGRRAYYTTPLIALTEQKFAEMQHHAERWGFSRDDVGLVTGNRRVNPDARVLVVVAEILVNRLLHESAFDFSDVAAVVMDEFHNFADFDRGIVWELALALLPKHVRLLLLSATVGNALDFVLWLKRAHGRDVQLVQGTERRVPLSYQWVPDMLLNEQIDLMAQGSPDERRTPALLFCFNRDECWDVAEQLKGQSLLPAEARQKLVRELELHDWSRGAGPKLKQMLMRGVGVHHAGMLPRYRRIVEDLYQRKLLAVAVCTETLAAGINLPARSVVLTTLLKGPHGKKKIIEASSAHQIFGRAGRPQYDDRGYVYVLAHEDDVRILRWKVKYDAIPENTKDPGLLAAKKALKKKRPTRRDTEQYWNEAQFDKLKASPPGKLVSRGLLPWRLLAYLIQLSPEVSRIRSFLHKRLMDSGALAAGEEELVQMLKRMHHGGFVRLEPPPPDPAELAARREQRIQAEKEAAAAAAAEARTLLFGASTVSRDDAAPAKAAPAEESREPEYVPQFAHATEKLPILLHFKSINPMYGAFLLEHLGLADANERMQLFESVLELPRPLLRKVRVPFPEDLPPGPLATQRLDADLVRRGLIAAPAVPGAEEEEDDGGWEEELPRQPALADKMRLLFDAEYPRVHSLNTQAVWAAGELLVYNGNFDKYIRANDLVKQEGLIFRHVLRLILLCNEFAQLTPVGADPAQWQSEMRQLSDALTAACREVDPDSTDKFIEDVQKDPLVQGEAVESPHASNPGHADAESGQG